MSKGEVEFTKDNEYYTPRNLVCMFGQFDYDPATTYRRFSEIQELKYIRINMPPVVLEK